MKLPLRIISIDKIKRFVDFAVAGAPTTEGIKPSKGTARPTSKTQSRSPKKANSKPAAKSGSQKKFSKSSRKKRP
jgi:hypothetical protein